MKKSEVEFVDALRKVGLSRSLCESVNDIRKVIFEPEEEPVEQTGDKKYELTDEMTKLEKVEAVIRKVASLVSMDRIYPNIYDTNARTRSGDVLRQIFDEDEKNIKICMDIFREAEDKNAKPKHIFGITVPPRGEVGVAFNTNSEIAKILLDKVPECKAVRTGQAFRKDDGMDVRLSADFIGDYFNKIMSALDDFRDSRTVMPRCADKPRCTNIPDS